MEIHERYSLWSATYDDDRNLTRDLDQTVTSEALSGGGGPLGSGAILELGCGTGKNTSLLAQIGAHVQALDFSQGMIEKARARMAGSNVAFAVADITGPWPCGAGSIDLVVCNLVLEHIAELPFIFAEAARVLRAGGRFFISELHPFRQYRGAQAAFAHGGEHVLIPAFVHHVSDFATAAEAAGLRLARLREHWHAEDQGGPPRLISFLFER